MARMHSRKKGKSGSKKPMKSNKAIWEKYNDKEVVLLIEKLAKEGKTSSEIGITLRDSYGIPDIRLITKKTLTSILSEQNKHDQPSIRGLTLTESKIRRLAKYYKSRSLLPESWRYSRTNAKLLIE